MKKVTQKILSFIIPALGIFIASPAFAQFTKPFPDLVTCSGAACNWCSVFEMIQRVFNTAVYIMFPLIVIFIMYAAILYIIGSTSGSEDSLKKARSTLTDAIIGMIIMLLTFIIVNATIVGITGTADIEDFLSVDCNKINTEPPISPSNPPQ